MWSLMIAFPKNQAQSALLYIPPMIWASEVNFDSGSVCMVLASHDYDEVTISVNTINLFQLLILIK